MKRIGIFSGTFDPIHNGHLAFAEKAIEDAQLDKLFFMPEPRPRNKQGVKSIKHRLAMVKIAAKDNSKFGIIELRQPQFSVNSTLPALYSRFSKEKLAMLFGEDVVSKMLAWDNVEKLLNSCELIIGVRTANKSSLEENIKTLQQTKSISFDYQLITTTNSNISSSSVRKQILKGKFENLPAGVKNYIQNNKLYISAAETGSGS